jgi:hypothetical protein
VAVGAGSLHAAAVIVVVDYYYYYYDCTVAQQSCGGASIPISRERRYAPTARVRGSKDGGLQATDDHRAAPRPAVFPSARRHHVGDQGHRTIAKGIDGIDDNNKYDHGIDDNNIIPASKERSGRHAVWYGSKSIPRGGEHVHDLGGWL